MKHILHICSDYSQQKLYQNLILELSKHSVKQTVFVPVRSEQEIGKYDILNNDKVKLHYAFILKKYHRFFYFVKIRLLYKYIINSGLLKDVDVIHAHFLYSDGGVALKIKQKFKIPYLVAVRNTDVNLFMKWFFYLQPFAKKILIESRKIIFITPSYKNIIKKNFGSISTSKFLVIPNGISKNWLNRKINHRKVNRPLKILYVGDFSKNKNVSNLIDFVNKIQSEINCSLSLVGGGGNDEKCIYSLISKQTNNCVNYLGKISDESKLIDIYNQHDLFVMLSTFETFGVVYIEAISQGLPIIFTKGQGVDGYFDLDDFAFPCEVNSFENFRSAIFKINSDYEKRSLNALKASKNFDWEIIANEYVNIYNNSN